MDNEKKKKKNKKKKNKSGKTDDNVPAHPGEQTSQSNNRVNVVNQSPQNPNSEVADVQNKGYQISAEDSDRQPINGTEIYNSVEAEKLNWLDREVSLERKIRELQEQLDVQLQKEADLETIILESQNIRNSWHQKEAELTTRVSDLQTEKDSWLQKEESLFIMAGYEKKINQLVDETSTLRSMGVRSKEKLTQMEEEKVTLAQRENSAAETNAYLNKDNARLRAQVIELEASRNDISHQNQQLKEHISDLQSKIENLENSVASHSSSERTLLVTENEDMKSQLEAAQALVEKLLSENEKLVEKVRRLNAELQPKSATTESLFPTKSDVRIAKAVGIAESSAPGTDPMPSSSSSSSSSGRPMLSDKVMESLNDEMVRLKSKAVHHTSSEGSDSNRIPQASMESAEIVQIPLNESEVSVPEATTSAPAKEEVPLADAPLIGAPFRLISFVARYVSGADLVNKGDETR